MNTHDEILQYWYEWSISQETCQTAFAGQIHPSVNKEPTHVLHPV